MSSINEDEIMETVYTYVDEDDENTSLNLEGILTEKIYSDETENQKTEEKDAADIEEALSKQQLKKEGILDNMDISNDEIKDEDEQDNFLYTASVGGIVWIDENKNGVLEKDEKGYPNVLVNLYSYPDNKLLYTAITDEKGKYFIENVIPGKYRLVFSNIPGNYSFITTNGYVTNTGVCPRILDFSTGNEYDDCNAPISLTIAPINLESVKEYLNVSFVESQIVAMYRSINLGHRISRNQKICADAAELKVESGQVYLVNYSANVKFAQEFNVDDYVALQFMINGMYIAEGFSYTKNQGLINGTCLINAVNKTSESIINLVNVSTKAVRMDNLSITIVKVS